MAKDRLQQFIAKHEDAAATSNGFAHEIHLDFIQLAKILAVEFDHKKDKAKSDLDKLFGGKIPSQKELLFLKYPNCAICGVKFKTIAEATKDHIKPKAKGGKNEITNYQLLCKGCNSRKGDFYNPDDPNKIVYKKNKANVKFMLEQGNLIDGIEGQNALEKAYAAWNYLWPLNALSMKVLRQTQYRLLEGLQSEIKEQQLIDWCVKANLSTTFEEIKKNHIEFQQIQPFESYNSAMGRIIMNWQLAKNDLPLCVILEKDKEAYFQWFKET